MSVQAETLQSTDLSRRNTHSDVTYTDAAQVRARLHPGDSLRLVSAARARGYTPAGQNNKKKH